MTTLDKIKFILQKLPHKTQVSFALYCAKDVFSLIKGEDSSLKAKACIDLTQRWLNDEAVTNAELMDVANAANAASATTSAAIYAAFDAASAASTATSAASTATSAAIYAAYAADFYAADFYAASTASTATSTASAVFAAAYAAKEKKLLEYLNWFKLSKLECLIYGLNK